MRSHSSFNFFSLCYMMMTYALMFICVLVFIDFAIGESSEDVWTGRMTLQDYFLEHALLYLSIAGAGAAAGFIIWFIGSPKS
ncbi:MULTISPECIES: hypothetical protein [Kluyvera]|uniref:Uncharacterized protein n=1 Tax=Kluyvera sichuanensis TaxID=2725494 RepID=A0ABR6RVB0_9ENTR|nr:MULTISPECIES: hypothetical protein [Kluyvera]MBC1187025.1 hypothetical protein [Kluyvera sichuanensis]MBW9461465.1 hypothetical protein [Kluyvera sp. EC_51]